MEDLEDLLALLTSAQDNDEAIDSNVLLAIREAIEKGDASSPQLVLHTKQLSLNS